MTKAGKWKGQKLCNGDCKWTDHLFNYVENDDGLFNSIKQLGSCVEKKDSTSGTGVFCGGHRAPTCPKCPINTKTEKYMGKNWCAGDCSWGGDDVGCISKEGTLKIIKYIRTL